MFADTDIERFESDIVLSLWQLFDSIRRLVVRTSYAVLVSMTIAFLLRSALLFVCRRLAMTSSRCRKLRCGDGKAVLTTAVDGIINSCCGRSKNVIATDYDEGGHEAEDDNENDDDAAGSPQHSLNSVGAILHEQAPVDFRYVETKV
jgi:hypothetical protein